MGNTQFARCFCCFRKYKIDELLEDEDDEYVPAKYVGPLSEEDEPDSFFRSSVLSIYKNVDSIYKKVSEWSLPKNPRVNLFTLSADDLERYEDRGFFDDVVDKKF